TWCTSPPFSSRNASSISAYSNHASPHFWSGKISRFGYAYIKQQTPVLRHEAIAAVLHVSVSRRTQATDPEIEHGSDPPRAQSLSKATFSGGVQLAAGSRTGYADPPGAVGAVRVDLRAGVK